jgi:hypothetical protein
MNRTPLFMLLCAMPACFTAAARAGELTEHVSQSRTLHFAGPGEHTLEVRDIEGDITVVAYDGPDVQMIVDKSLRADNAEEMRAAHRDVVLDTADNAATLHAIARYPNQQTCGAPNGYTSRPGYHVRFDFTIRVPRAVRLKLCTINDGVVRVSGTTGDFDISNVNGRIAMTDVTGSGNAVTVNGAVAAAFASVPQRSSTFRTVNGDVVITLPHRPSSGLHMKTFNGKVANDFAAAPDVGEAEKSGVDLTLATLNGDVRVLRGSK